MGEITKINIGSDIKLSVFLSNGIDPLNIHSVQAYLINTSVKSDLENQIKQAYSEYDNAVENKKDKIQFISRFPMEPHFNNYASTHYDICQCGCPHYYATPRCYRPVYCGFGVHPHTFDGFKNHLWAHYDMDPLMCNIKKAEDVYHKNERFLQYQARVESTGYADKIMVYFPGKDQLTVGIYKLIIVAQVYQPGYSNCSQFKTVVADYDDVFELVYTGGGDAQLNVGVVPTYSNSGEDGQHGLDLHVKDGVFDLDKNQLTLILNSNNPIDPIDTSAETGWWDEPITQS